MEIIETVIMIKENLLEQVDPLAKEMNISRNHLFELALQHYLSQHENKLLLEKINAAYADGSDSEEQELVHRFSHMKKYEKY